MIAGEYNGERSRGVFGTSKFSCKPILMLVLNTPESQDSLVHSSQERRVQAPKVFTTTESELLVVFNTSKLRLPEEPGSYFGIHRGVIGPDYLSQKKNKKISSFERRKVYSSGSTSVFGLTITGSKRSHWPPNCSVVVY
jgi:hypothetical protein